jgi:formate/nitrite transporter FocA (FNT family)
MTLKEMYHLCCHCRQFKSIPTGIPIKAATLNRKINLREQNMKDVGEEKIDENTEELEIESEEKARGEKIEIDEDRLPSRAMAIHEHIRQDGEKEMERDAMALFWSAIAAGLSMGASLLAKGIFHVQLEGVPGGFLLENLGYTFGFIIVIMARQQLFTENTVTAVLPVMQNPTLGNFGLLMRLWSVVLLGNIIGTGIAAWAFEYMPIFDEPTRDAFVKIGMDVMKNTPLEMFSNAIISGWIIATMVWMFPSAGSAKIVVIILMTWLIALADTTHIVVGSVEILYLVFNGTLHWSDFFWPFALPTLAGNICGGTFIFALLSHAQIRNDMSNKRKAELKARENDDKSTKKST